jgi:hypothetical protein
MEKWRRAYVRVLGGEAAAVVVVLHARDLAEERAADEALGLVQRQVRRRHLRHRLRALLLVHAHVGRVRSPSATYTGT